MKRSERTKKLIKKQKEIRKELDSKRKVKLNENCEARKSKIHHYGVFALKNIKKGARIIEYTGEKIPKYVTDKRLVTYGHTGAVYFFSVNKIYDIDGAVGGAGAQFINHSCNTNCEAVNEDNTKIFIEATKNIKKGQELTYDYGFPLEDYEDHICKCGSKNCVGFIVDEKHRKKLKKKLAKKKK